MSSRRFNVGMRVFAAILPGFVLTNIGSIFIGFLLPVDKAESVMMVSVFSFVLYTGIILWIFHVETLKRMWLGLALSIALTGIGSYLLYLLEVST